jgi:aryl carrier-like protein
VLREGFSVSEVDLRAFVFSRLVPAKVPTQILLVPSIPKGPTGKIQRIGLHEKLGHLLRQPFVPAGTAIEKMLVLWWREVLSVDAVGLHDNFFMLGGDSLRAMRLVARIQDELFVELSVAELFRQPTVEQFSRVVEQAQEDRTAALAAYVDQLSDDEVEKLLSGNSGSLQSS